ncbi:MAG TPA: hypothetical protein DCY74_01370, partial [Clostridiales bacterium]|nr:hypothetical protein [Clostridiales bacterium]
SLKKTLSNHGYTLVYFSHLTNSEPVAKLLLALGLTTYAMTVNAFTYKDCQFRLVFILENLSDEEQKVLLAHELGHIVLKHTDKKCSGTEGILREKEANEFALELLRIPQKKPYFIAAVLCVTVLSILLTFFLVMEASHTVVTGDTKFWVTTAGKKFHRNTCGCIKWNTSISSLSYKELLEEGYEPCKLCNPLD